MNRSSLLYRAAAFAVLAGVGCAAPDEDRVGESKTDTSPTVSVAGIVGQGRSCGAHQPSMVEQAVWEEEAARRALAKPPATGPVAIPVAFHVISADGTRAGGN